MTANERGALPYIYDVSKYDPADRDERGYYIGAEDIYSDHGPVEAAYLAAVAAFAEDSKVTELTIREPTVVGTAHFGVEPPIAGYGLAGLFPPDLTGYHDGTQVSVAVGLELVRAMLRDNGAWCRLEVEGRFFVHVGYDQYVYVGSTMPCQRAVALTHQQGLFAEPLTQSPYGFEPTRSDLSQRRSADEPFWAELVALATERGTLVLEEGYVYNASRWHRITADNLQAVRSQLTPRSRLRVWPDLHADVNVALAGLPDEGSSEIVWEDHNGHITSRYVDEEDYPQLPILLADASAAMILSGYADDLHPLLAAVLPDPDGVLRARWTP